MTDHSTSSLSQDPEQIERDIRRTQEEMSRTVDRIGDQLTPRNLMNALLDKAEENNIDARYLLDGARRNPLALAMLAGGAIWLVSDSDAKLPKVGRSSAGSRAGDMEDHPDPYHQDYVRHMSAVEMREGEAAADYQRRRDLARANYFMVERGHEEDDSSFRQRLDDAAERFREKRHEWSQSSRKAGRSISNGGAAAVERAQEAYTSNPLIGGLLAAAVGAVFGTALPISTVEEEQLSSAGQAARDALGDKKDQLLGAAREKKDQLVSRAEEAGQAPDAEPLDQQQGLQIG